MPSFAPEMSVSADSVHDSACLDCGNDTLTEGPLNKRTGFNCPGCTKSLHFNCAKISENANGCLPRALIALFASPALKVRYDDLLFCPDCGLECEPEQIEGAENTKEIAVDKEAWVQLQNLQSAMKEMQAKLSLLIDFLVPDSDPAQANSAVKLGCAENILPNVALASGPTYASTAQKGVKGFSAIVRTAVVEANLEIDEAEKMSRTVIFDNVPEIQTPATDSNHLLHLLSLDGLVPEEVLRLGRPYGQKPRKLKIICRSVFDRDVLLGSRVQDCLRDPNFPVRGVYVNPSASSGERRMGFLLRKRWNLLNEDSDEENSYFISRKEHRLVKKVNGKPEWEWMDEGFDDWVQGFEEKEKVERDRKAAVPKPVLQRARYPQPQQYSAKGQFSGQPQWQTIGKRGRPIPERIPQNTQYRSSSQFMHSTQNQGNY